MFNSLISIIIPVFNRKEFVEKMIKSIIRQTYKTWELILVDDGSTDGTFEMCEKLAEKDSRIHAYTRNVDCKGAPVCRNIGFKLAKGEYVIFFDSDDLIPPFCLQQRIEYMVSHPTLDFAIFPTIAFWKKLGDVNFYSGINVSSNGLRHLIDGLLPFLVVTNIYKKDFLLRNNILWDENMRFFQDQDFNIQCLSNNAHYEYASGVKFDYYYRSIPNSNSISRKLGNPENFDGFLYFMNKLFLLPPDSIKGNIWARRRRMVYIYRLIHSSVQKKEFIEWSCMRDKGFYFLFKVSDKLYHFFASIPIITNKYAMILAFPYYFFYNKYYLIRCRYLAHHRILVRL